ncbi:C4-dicarboxylate ABC transporter permease [Marispirochaeta aestuarii]|uniref:C4-dicarboxylate ABC transporter permease n=1 Tax=Marispirochaeta aestuarii TaxID=1963862 RepID=A0A1Y1RV23_9SPIO|nr:TRAP transporter large permease [Marispirochaeta aestuarii]ORC31809.1 C4-dicarboxylate ABC transporter permease [Marispirochaeta aestuarii]
MIIAVSVLFFTLLVLGVPIGFTIGLAGLAGLYFINMDLAFFSMAPLQYFSGLDMFTLLAMPFFILAGEIMNRTGITERLVQFANILVGHLRGGLAHANILASVFFAGMTGAAVSDTAAIGTMLIPAMEKDGYDRDFAAAVTASSSIIGPTIPPSNMMVIYGSLMNVSIAGLFAAGFLPGILLAGLLMIIAAIFSVKRGYPKSKRSSLKEMLIGFRNALIPLFMPVIILGGILSGIFTPTEAAAVAVAYAAVIGFLVLKSLSLKDIPAMLIKTSRITGVVFLIIGTASILSWVLSFSQVPQKIAALMLSVTDNPKLILLMILGLMVAVGLFMDIAAALIILGPILHPIAVSMGIEPIHFGIIMVLSLNIALMTPPVGACLFVACSIADLKLSQLSRAILPFIVVEIIALFIVAYVPWFSLFLPRLLGF